VASNGPRLVTVKVNEVCVPAATDPFGPAVTCRSGEIENSLTPLPAWRQRSDRVVRHG
jgi:hypothetical protein